MVETKLPRRQQEVLDYLRRAIAERGYVPSIREIVEALGVHSTSTIHYHLTGLAERGLIRWEKGKNRAIQLLESPTAATPTPAAAPIEFPVETPKLPILGRIAAGRPIEAIGDGTETLDLTGLWATGNNYVLEVKGESMIEDHIMPGDMVIVKPQATARDGEIVVALLDNGEATLKRLYREAGRIRLQPANSTMDPIYVDSVTVQGRVVGVIRNVH
ncbi:MAG TPA: transcriptional repressor LexA [Stenomitos sp.]